MLGIWSVHITSQLVRGSRCRDNGSDSRFEGIDATANAVTADPLVKEPANKDCPYNKLKPPKL